MRNVKMIPKLGLVLLLLLCLAGPVLADGIFDSKTNLICATRDVVACEYASGCIQGSPGSFDLPDFLVIDFKKNQVTASKETGIKNVSPLKTVETTQQQIILQGVENHRGWTAAIDRKTGHLSITSSGADLSYMIFGTCTFSGE